MLTPDAFFRMFGFYEESRFVRVAVGYDYVCVHAAPPVPLSADSCPAPTQQLVRLRQIADGSGHGPDGLYRVNGIGWAGQCPTCGKVYYRN